MLIVVTCHICSPTDSFKPQLMFHCCSVTQSCPTFCHPMDSSMPGFPFLHHPPSPRVCSDSCPLSWWCHLILCRPLLLPPSIFSSIGVFSSELTLCIRWPKYWSFSFSINPPNEYSGLISFRIDWFDPLAVQGTLKSLLQHDSSKASILWHTAFFTVQLSHLYMTPGKVTALTIWFVDKVISLIFNMLCKFVIAFLPRSKRLSISWLQSPSAVTLEPKKITLSLFPRLFAMKQWDGMLWSSFFECWVLSHVSYCLLYISPRRFLIPTML